MYMFSLQSNPTCLVNPLRPGDVYMRKWTGSSLVQVMAYQLFENKRFLISVWHQAITWTNDDGDLGPDRMSLGQNGLMLYGLITYYSLVIIGPGNGFLPSGHQTSAWHDCVIKWKHFPHYWPFVRGIHRVPGEFPAQRPVTRSFDVYFDLCLNKRLSKQWWGWWFETLLCPLWRHCNEPMMNCHY